MRTCVFPGAPVRDFRAPIETFALSIASHGVE